jgi:hypothetical protein
LHFIHRLPTSTYLAAKQDQKKERRIQKMKQPIVIMRLRQKYEDLLIGISFMLSDRIERISRSRIVKAISDQRGDVPGWVLVVLMTTGLVTAIWTIAAPRLTAILKNSLDAMNGIR